VRRNDADLAAMAEALDAMAADIQAGELGEEGDRLFHQAVTTAARSPLLQEFMAAIAGPIAETRRSSLGEPGRPPLSLAAHQRILEAIRRGDGPAARQAMRRHVRMVADVGLLRWSAVDREHGDGQNPGLSAAPVPARLSEELVQGFPAAGAAAVGVDHPEDYGDHGVGEDAGAFPA